MEQPPNHTITRTDPQFITNPPVENARITAAPGIQDRILQLLQVVNQRFDNLENQLAVTNQRINNLERIGSMEYRKNSICAKFDESVVYFFPSLVENHHLPEQLPQNRGELFLITGDQCNMIERAYGITPNQGDGLRERRERIANFIGVNF